MAGRQGRLLDAQRFSQLVLGFLVASHGLQRGRQIVARERDRSMLGAEDPKLTRNHIAGHGLSLGVVFLVCKHHGKVVEGTPYVRMIGTLGVVGSKFILKDRKGGPPQDLDRRG